MIKRGVVCPWNLTDGDDGWWWGETAFKSAPVRVARKRDGMCRSAPCGYGADVVLSCRGRGGRVCRVCRACRSRRVFVRTGGLQCFRGVCLLCLPFSTGFPREGPSPLNPGDSRWKWSKAEESAPQQWAHEQGSQGLKGHAITGHGTWDLERRRNPSAMSARYRPCARSHKARPTRLTQMEGQFLFSLVVG